MRRSAERQGHAPATATLPSVEVLPHAARPPPRQPRACSSPHHPLQIQIALQQLPIQKQQRRSPQRCPSPADGVGDENVESVAATAHKSPPSGGRRDGPAAPPGTAGSGLAVEGSRRSAWVVHGIPCGFISSGFPAATNALQPLPRV